MLWRLSGLSPREVVRLIRRCGLAVAGQRVRRFARVCRAQGRHRALASWPAAQRLVMLSSRSGIVSSAVTSAAVLPGRPRSRSACAMTAARPVPERTAIVEVLPRWPADLRVLAPAPYCSIGSGPDGVFAYVRIGPLQRGDVLKRPGNQTRCTAHQVSRPFSA